MSSSQSGLVGFGRKVSAPRGRTAGSAIGDPSQLGPPRPPWEDPPTSAGMGLVVDSWPGARVTSPTVGRRAAKVSLTMSVDPTPREFSRREGGAGTLSTAGGNNVRSSMTHLQWILAPKGKLQCPMSG